MAIFGLHKGVLRRLANPLLRRIAWGALLSAGWLLVLPPVRAEGVLIPAPNRVDIAYDNARGLLYISGGSRILRYKLNTASFLSPIETGGSTLGIDISPDGNSLVVADQNLYGIRIINLGTLAVQNVNFSPTFGEGGTFTAAYGADGSILVTSTYQGSGTVPLRRYVPSTSTTTTLATIQQNTMLSANADRSIIGLAESNSSDGPFDRYRVSDRNLLRKSGYDNGTAWFNYEIAVSRDGQQYVLPTYGGAFITDGNLVKQSIIGEYAAGQPVGAVYHPSSDLIYFPWAQSTQVRVFDSKSLLQVGSHDFESEFGSNGNYAFANGRAKISRDGSLLFVTVDGGVRYVTLNAVAPTALTASPGDGRVSLNWAASPEATSYLVYQGTSAGNESPTPVRSGVTGTSVVIDGLVNGQTYYFKVAAQTPDGVSSPSSEVSATPAAPPAQVTGLGASTSSRTVHLSWSVVAQADTYLVYQGTVSGAESLVADDLASTSYTAAWLNDGTTYYFKVAAKNAAGIGPMSAEIQARPRGLPPAPVGLVATAGNAQVNLAWPAAADADRYDVYIGTVSGHLQSSPILSGVVGTTATIVGLSNGQTYFFDVAARNSTGAGPHSNEASATPMAQAEQPAQGGSSGALGWLSLLPLLIARGLRRRGR